jgi:GT2 family glycosyltransferase
VCFVDDDVEAPPEWLSAMVAGIRTHPDVAVFAGRVRLRLEHPTRRDCPRHPFAASLELGEDDREISGALGANLAVRRRAFALVGPFDDWTTGGDDTEWFDRLTAAGGRIMYLGRASVWHRRTASDLRPGRIVRSSFRRGVIAHRYFIRAGQRDLRGRAATLVPQLLWTAARERCLGALANAALQAGFAYGLLRHPRLRPPPRPGPTADGAGSKSADVKSCRSSSR